MSDRELIGVALPANGDSGNHADYYGGTSHAQGIAWLTRLVALFALAPITMQAAEMMDCTDTNMMKANGDMDKMAASEKKTMGIKEMTMAKEMMEGHGGLQDPT